jgi:hypothetical protein
MDHTSNAQFFGLLFDTGQAAPVFESKPFRMGMPPRGGRTACLAAPHPTIFWQRDPFVVPADVAFRRSHALAEHLARQNVGAFGAQVIASPANAHFVLDRMRVHPAPPPVGWLASRGVAAGSTPRQVRRFPPADVPFAASRVFIDQNSVSLEVRETQGPQPAWITISTHVPPATQQHWKPRGGML